MAIAAACPSCDYRFRVADSAEGKVLKCPKCQSKVKIGRSNLVSRDGVTPGPVSKHPQKTRKPTRSGAELPQTGPAPPRTKRSKFRPKHDLYLADSRSAVPGCFCILAFLVVGITTIAKGGSGIMTVMGVAMIPLGFLGAAIFPLGIGTMTRWKELRDHYRGHLPAPDRSVRWLLLLAILLALLTPVTFGVSAAIALGLAILVRIRAKSQLVRFEAVISSVFPAVLLAVTMLLIGAIVLGERRRAQLKAEWAAKVDEAVTADLFRDQENGFFEFAILKGFEIKHVHAPTTLPVKNPTNADNARGDLFHVGGGQLDVFAQKRVVEQLSCSRVVMNTQNVIFVANARPLRENYELSGVSSDCIFLQRLIDDVEDETSFSGDLWSKRVVSTPKEFPAIRLGQSLDDEQRLEIDGKPAIKIRRGAVRIITNGQERGRSVASCMYQFRKEGILHTIIAAYKSSEAGYAEQLIERFLGTYRGLKPAEDRGKLVAKRRVQEDVASTSPDVSARPIRPETGTNRSVRQERAEVPPANDVSINEPTDDPSPARSRSPAKEDAPAMGHPTETSSSPLSDRDITVAVAAQLVDSVLQGVPSYERFQKDCKQIWQNSKDGVVLLNVWKRAIERIRAFPITDCRQMAQALPPLRWQLRSISENDEKDQLSARLVKVLAGIEELCRKMVRAHEATMSIVDLGLPKVEVSEEDVEKRLADAMAIGGELERLLAEGKQLGQLAAQESWKERCSEALQLYFERNNQAEVLRLRSFLTHESER